MQAIIMAAGKGSRLGKMTEDKPKCFIEINGKRLIDYNLDMLNKFGIDDIVIVVGYMSEFFEKEYGGRKDIRLVYNPYYEMSNVLGSFWCGQDLLNDDFVYLHADTLCDIGIFKELIESRDDIVLPVDFGHCDEEAMKVKIVNNEVEYINKTMEPADADGEFIGIAKISKDISDSLKKVTIDILKNKKFDSYFEAALQKVIDGKKCSLKTIDTKGRFWCEIDFLDDYEKAISTIPEISNL